MNRSRAKQAGGQTPRCAAVPGPGHHRVTLCPLLVAILPLLAITACSSQSSATRPTQAGPAACKPSQLAFHLDDGHCESPASIALTIDRRTVPAEFHGHLCGAGGQPSMYTLAPFHLMATSTPMTAANTLIYTCDDGRTVQAAYPDTDTAVLTFDRQTHRLRIAISADGARYVGDRWQWWSKGMHDARLAPLQPGESYASAEGVGCRAP